MQIMPFEDAKTYRFNPFDLTKVWPHVDYPLIEVGKLVLDRKLHRITTPRSSKPRSPPATRCGHRVQPGQMLLARTFAYADAHRARIGVNYKQIPVNAPNAPVHSYSKDGAMRVIPVSDPVYAPNSKGGPQADPSRTAEALWYTDGEMVRRAYTLRPEDDDWGQAGTLVRDVMDDAERERLVSNVAGHLRNGSPNKSSNAPSSTGKTSTRKPATRSKRW